MSSSRDSSAPDSAFIESLNRSQIPLSRKFCTVVCGKQCSLTWPVTTIVSNLAPGKKISVTVATDKSCVFNLHGAYADGSSTDSTSVDLCKDKNVNLVE
jgi:hypothetical protein